jgi:hypothetical protein
MGNTSNHSKQLWNQAHYTQIKVSVKPELAAAFKGICASARASMAYTLSVLMAQYCHERTTAKKPPDYSTRRLRRAAIMRMTQQLQIIINAEAQYRDNIPENLQQSSVAERADETISALDEALELLSSAY